LFFEKGKRRTLGKEVKDSEAHAFGYDSSIGYGGDSGRDGHAGIRQDCASGV